MRNQAEKVLFRRDAAVIGLIALAVMAVMLPWCTGTSETLHNIASRGFDFVSSHQN